MKNSVLVTFLFVLLISFSKDASAATLSNIQKGTTILPAGSGSITQAVTAVDLTKSYLVFTIHVNSNRTGRAQIGGFMSANNQITFNRFENNPPAVTIEWQIIEFSAGVNVQRGVITNLPAAGTNVTLGTAVNLSNSWVTVNCRKDGGQYGSDDFVSADLTTTTNLYVDREAGGGNIQQVYWQVVEYTSSNVQKITATLGAGVDSLNITLGSAVNFNKSMLVGSHRNNADINADDFSVAELYDANTVLIRRVGTAGRQDHVLYVIEFTDNTDVIHGASDMNAGQTSATEFICGITASSAAVIPPTNFFRPGANCENSDDDAGVSYAAFTLTNSSITATRAASGFEALFPYQIVEFTAAVPVGCTVSNQTLPRTIGLCSFVTLPVELSEFEAKLDSKNHVLLNWTTMSESDNDYFIIEKSIDGENFEEIGLLDGSGNSSAELDYNYIDREPFPGVNYYRLKQVDFNGDFSHSFIAPVYFKLNLSSEFTLFPNPVISMVTLYTEHNVDMDKLSVYDLEGRAVALEISQTEHGFLLDLSSLESGVYIVHLGGEVQKLIKE